MLMVQLKQNQPRIKHDIPVTGQERVLQALTLIAFLWGIGYLIAQWSDLPATVPAHYNGKGEIDRWGSKWELAILPGIGLILYVGLTILSRFPHLYNYPVTITEENAVRQYLLARKMIGWTNLEILVLFSYIEWTSIQSALGKGDGMSMWSIPILLIAIFGTMAIYFVRAFRSK
ncbi:DUF1648 domain-containing protein [Cohnella cholangitidis]|uniref:DUF1648 domain-containing protein n=2 Tax=Cohnella cholangitidis TaxID=2598458 RepID=A0A7G5BZY6_9BACL|nr:DUF1648 domain-containing protein [Cohnella cholangitidis]